MSTNTDTIHFEEITFPTTNASPKEPDYASLYGEMLEKCKPENYMTPIYDAQKVHNANLIYSILRKHTEWRQYDDLNLPPEMVEQRKKAENVLQIHFTNQRLYTYLREKCDPRQFTGSNYHQDRLDKANQLYAELERKQDSWDDLINMKEKVLAFYAPIEEEKQAEKQAEEQAAQARAKAQALVDKQDKKDCLSITIIIFTTIIIITIIIVTAS